MLILRTPRYTAYITLEDENQNITRKREKKYKYISLITSYLPRIETPTELILITGGSGTDSVVSFCFSETESLRVHFTCTLNK